MFLNRPNWWFFFFVYLCFFKKINTSKIACFSRIRSRIAGVEGEHADHYTTATTALVVVVSQNIALVSVEFTLKFDLKIFWKWRNLLKINIHAGGILSTRKHLILIVKCQKIGPWSVFQMIAKKILNKLIRKLDRLFPDQIIFQFYKASNPNWLQTIGRQIESTTWQKRPR